MIAPMISRAKRSAEILQRFQCNDPLNLSAIEIECPWLLDGLFNPQKFVGWRESIEAAGIAISDIRVEPLSSVVCLECGFEGASLWSHLSWAHGTNCADYCAAYPGAETSSEAQRATRMANRHGRKAKIIMPHWEPAWSRNYALDRIHEFSRQGIPLNYSYVSTHEPGFPAYVRRIFPSWDAGLEAAGINTQTSRLNREATLYSEKELLKYLRDREKNRPSDLHIRTARSAHSKTAITAAFRQHGTYEKALAAAGIDPITKIPALADPVKLLARETLLREARENCKRRVAYDPVWSKGFIDRYSKTIRDFYGSWTNFSTSLKLKDRELFHSPGYQIYDSQDACIAALQERVKVGLGLRADDIRSDNPSLGLMSMKHFVNISAALKAANLERLPRGYDIRDYASGEDVIAEIRRRHQAGESLYYSSLELGGGRSILKWSRRFFGNYKNALAAAGIPPLPPKAYEKRDKTQSRTAIK
jgi:hypothetical protein